MPLNRLGVVMKKVRGFSLIELMIVVAIVAIITSIAYPAYQEQMQKRQPDCSVGETVFLLNFPLATLMAIHPASGTAGGVIPHPALSLMWNRIT